jgi:hypothetical protein
LIEDLRLRSLEKVGKPMGQHECVVMRCPGQKGFGGQSKLETCLTLVLQGLDIHPSCDPKLLEPLAGLSCCLSIAGYENTLVMVNPVGWNGHEVLQQSPANGRAHEIDLLPVNALER